MWPRPDPNRPDRRDGREVAGPVVHIHRVLGYATRAHTLRDMMNFDLRSQSVGRMDPPPRSAVETAQLVPLLFGSQPGMLELLAKGAIVFVFRRPDIELWELRGVDPAAAPIDDLIRSIACYGAEPDAMLFPSAIIERDAEGRRRGVTLRFVAECRRRRAEVVLRVDASGQVQAPDVTPRKLGKVARAWIGTEPPPELRIEALGPVGVRPEPHEA